MKWILFAVSVFFTVEAQARPKRTSTSELNLLIERIKDKFSSYQGEDSRVELQSPQFKVSKRFRLRTRRVAGESFHFRLDFLEPPSLKGSVMLGLLVKDKVPEVWFKSRSGKARKLASKKQRSAFLGSDFQLSELHLDPSQVEDLFIDNRGKKLEEGWVKLTLELVGQKVKSRSLILDGRTMTPIRLIDSDGYEIRFSDFDSRHQLELPKRVEKLNPDSKVVSGMKWLDRKLSPLPELGIFDPSSL